MCYIRTVGGVAGALALLAHGFWFSGPSGVVCLPTTPVSCLVGPLGWLVVGCLFLVGLPARALRTRHWRDAFGVCSVPPVRIPRAYELCNASQKLALLARDGLLFVAPTTR